ncbi:MAG: helix-turn-helix transcriptional regulator [Sulfitobacter sp.]|nr:helix-turn-helix transcriptional regulator [Sulfitobacter sp.]
MAHTTDTHVGKMIRQRRWLIGMTQQQLAESVGVKFQQIQKYETGVNRVSASRLWEIAGVLGVPVSSFFEGLHVDDAAGSAVSEILPDDPMGDKDVIELVRAFYGIPTSQRYRLLALARVLADTDH